MTSLKWKNRRASRSAHRINPNPSLNATIIPYKLKVLYHKWCSMCKWSTSHSYTTLLFTSSWALVTNKSSAWLQTRALVTNKSPAYKLEPWLQTRIQTKKAQVTTKQIASLLWKLLQKQVNSHNCYILPQRDDRWNELKWQLVIKDSQVG